MGYARIENGSLFYSKDLFWWNGVRIDHSEKDEFSGYRDINKRPLFAHDIVTLKSKRWFDRVRHYGLVRTHDGWVLENMEGSGRSPITLLDTAEALRFVSFSFLQTT